MRILRKVAKKSWDLLLNYGRSRTSNPNRFYFGLLKAIDSLGVLKILGSSFSVSRFTSAVSLPIDESNSIQKTDCSLLLVVTWKDFHTLPIAIEYAIKSQTSLNFISITIVVPERYRAEGESIVSSLSSRVSVISEDEYFTISETELLQKQYRDRSGWVKQQLIKVRHICKSDFQYTLILDADTLLIRKRTWFDDSGKQILFQSEEYNEDYYKFLDKFNFPNSKSHSFITHYMLFDRNRMISALKALGIYELQTQIEKIHRNALPDALSPFSLDFELYGQYLLSNQLCVLRKWSHIDIDPKLINRDRSRIKELEKLSLNWSSVSIHSWKQE